MVCKSNPMNTQISLLLAIIFTLLSVLHLYWVVGGKWGLSVAVPSQEDGDFAFRPPPLLTFIVAVGLAGMGIFELFGGGWLDWPFSRLWLQIGLGCITGIFLLRAMGDFKYSGFFKKVKETAYAKNDSRLYSPLCLFIGLGTLFLLIT